MLKLLPFLLFLSACSANSVRDLLGNMAGAAANAEVGYSASECFAVKQQCVEGNYQEWQTSDGKDGCSCQR